MYYCVNFEDVPKSQHAKLFSQYYLSPSNRVYRDFSGKCYMAFVKRPTCVDDSVIMRADPSKLNWTEISPEDVGQPGESF